MVDANQIWDVNTAIEWMEKLKEFQLLWIEEPTSPDDVLGHKKIAEALRYRCFILITFYQFSFRITIQSNRATVMYA